MIELLQERFKDITYKDQHHQYFYGEQELQSITKWLSSLKPEFNSHFWSILKAYTYSGYETKFIWNNFSQFKIIDPTLESGYTTVSIYDNHDHLKVTPEDVLDQWKIENSIGTTRGSFIHNYLENLENRILDQPKIELPNSLSTAQTINYINSLNVAKQLCLDFVKYAKENLILVAAEYAVGDPKLGKAGRFDRLYFNKLTQKYEIWDFKTDKKLRYKSSFGKIKEFDLPDCEFEKYSLQTSFYRKVIQDVIPEYQLGESKIVWFDLKENKYEIIECKDYTQLITTTLL